MRGPWSYCFNLISASCGQRSKVVISSSRKTTLEMLFVDFTDSTEASETVVFLFTTLVGSSLQVLEFHPCKSLFSFSTTPPGTSRPLEGCMPSCPDVYNVCPLRQFVGPNGPWVPPPPMGITFVIKDDLANPFHFWPLWENKPILTSDTTACYLGCFLNIYFKSTPFSVSVILTVLLCQYGFIYRVCYNKYITVKTLKFKTILIVGKIYIKFTTLTIFKCAVQWHLVSSHCYSTIITIHLQNYFHPTKLKPINSNSPRPLPSVPGKHHSTLCLYEFDYSRNLT